MASAAIINKENKVLVLKRSPGEKFLSGYWTIVGGKYEDSDKSIKDAVSREVTEETGLDVKIIKPINIQEFELKDKPGIRTVEVEIAYLCYANVDDIKLASEEHDSFRWINRSEVSKLDLITDETKQKLSEIFDVIDTESQIINKK